MKRFFDHINILVIPTNVCNLKCEYCFHNEYMSDDYGSNNMSYEMLERIFSITFPYYKTVNIIWHGGEPLCMGLEFYKKVVELQKQCNNNGTIVRNSIQTNMTLMTPQIACFLKENNFDVSTSYDGIINEKLRHNTEDFWRGKQIYEEFAGKCGLIMVVSKENINYLIESYEEFKNKKINYIMNPYTKSLNDKNDKLEISGKEYADKIIQFFEYWMYDKTCNIHVKYFQEIVEYMLFGKKSKCNVNSCLGKWVCVRPNGDVTPCNRHFPEKYSFGNIFEMKDIGESFDSKGFELLLSQAIARRNKCKECSIYEYCAGGCNNIALVYGGVENNNHEMCKALKIIYEHIEIQIKKIINDDVKTINPFLRRIIIKYKNSVVDSI